MTTLNEAICIFVGFFSITHKMFLESKCFEWKLQRRRKHAFGLVHFCCKSERYSLRNSP